MWLNLLEFQKLRRWHSIFLNFWSTENESRFSNSINSEDVPRRRLTFISKAQKVRFVCFEISKSPKVTLDFFFVPEARKMRLALLEFLKLRRCGSLCLNEFQKYKKVWPDLLKFLKLRRWDSIFWNLKSSECWFRRWSLIFHFWR